MQHSDHNRRQAPVGDAEMKSRDRTVPRRGTVLLVAMVCLSLVTLVLGGLLRLAVAHRRQVQQAHTLRQAEWLAEAGVERAAHRLSADPNYAGETWRLDEDDLGTGHAGQVVIAVGPEPSGGRRPVRVEATYPVASRRFSRRTIQVWVKDGVPP